MNGKRPLLVSSPQVTKFMQYAASLKPQVAKQGFDTIPFPLPVAAYIEVRTRILQEHSIPRSDGDNMVTTLQETWQSVTSVGGKSAVLGVLEDDRQVIEVHWKHISVRSVAEEGATAYVWVIGDRQKSWQEYIEFFGWLGNRVYTVSEESLSVVDFSALDNLMDTL